MKLVFYVESIDLSVQLKDSGTDIFLFQFHEIFHFYPVKTIILFDFLFKFRIHLRQFLHLQNLEKMVQL